jgi:phosphoglycerol transferase MdoB-like AlkP superfamily enzyme
MNSTQQPAGQQRTKPPLSEAAKASLAKTHTLFRVFVVSVLGAFFVYQLDVTYLWLASLLTVAGLVLGVMLLIRAARLKESRLVLIGTISGLVVSAIMVLLILVTALFFDEVRDYQACVGRALTDQAQSACRVQLQGSLPSQLP